MDYAKVLFSYDDKSLVVEYKNMLYWCRVDKSSPYRINSTVIVNVSPFYILSIVDDDFPYRYASKRTSTFKVFEPINIDYK